MSLQPMINNRRQLFSRGKTGPSSVQGPVGRQHPLERPLINYSFHPVINQSLKALPFLFFVDLETGGKAAPQRMLLKAYHLISRQNCLVLNFKFTVIN
ncbi:hypothetical protein CEXT_668691 [Caerostris extrusa]|uniref:Uncharacterized protein n=1 Tax=Caerostris extrusa TaxID=172846 RepID=A0AAV4T6C6_CAEEX|nr:hypothetical protein CEXT_668691 [Caerostris extrusa]